MTKKIVTILITLIMVTVICAPLAIADDDMLKRGSKGKSVEELQQKLMDLGIFKYDTITGYFGKITEDAVKTYQKNNGLKADGIVGKNTWAKLRAEQTAQNDAQDDTDSNGDQQEQSEAIEDAVEITGSISKGMEGEQVEAIQKRLQELGLYEYDRITGYYGSITKKAVMDFQKAYGLKEDGIVGKQTKEKLFSEYKETSLIPGMKNDDVKKLQERLEELGYYSYFKDGEYGAKTREAVVYFQSAHGLTTDGIAGTRTKQVLYSSAAKTEKEARRNQTSSTNVSSGSTDSNATVASGDATAENIIEFARTKLGCKYVYATEGPDTFDCTGFTSYVFSKFGISLPRTAYDQGYSQYGVKITDPTKLAPGDLVFFNTNKSDGDLSDHSGIYIGNGEFIHANSGSARSVVITNMNTSSFYTEAFSWGRRVLD